MAIFLHLVGPAAAQEDPRRLVGSGRGWAIFLHLVAIFLHPVGPVAAGAGRSTPAGPGRPPA